MNNQNSDLLGGFEITELGSLPEDWQVVSLGDVFIEVDNRVAKFPDSNADRFPVLSLTKNYGLMLQSERFGKRIALEDVNDYKVVKRGEIVYNPYVIWEGAIHILDRFDYGLVSPVYPVLETKLKYADPYFLDSILRTPLAIAAYNRFASGAVNRRRSIRRTDFMAIKIPLPPLLEQRAIARVLSTIQNSIDTQSKIITAVREMKKSLMCHLFTYGIVPIKEAEKVPLKDTEIGLVPEHWEVVKLGEVVSFKLGRTPARQVSQYWKPGSFPWVSIADLNYGLITDTREKISEIGYKEIFKKHCIPKGTLLLSFKLSIGKVGQLGMDAVHNEAIASVLPNETRAKKEYLFYLLPTLDFDKYLDQYMKGKTLNKDKLRIILVPLPPLPEQQEIARMLSATDEKIEAEERKKTSLRALFKTMLHLLMTGKVRIKDLEAAA
jgi:type I restriction enzyme S subunit